MRPAILAATLAFGTGSGVHAGPVKRVARRIGSLLLAWLDRRRTRREPTDERR